MENFAKILIVLLLSIDPIIGERVKITNVKCISFDESLAHFRTCYLKAIRRGLIVGNLYLENYTRDLFNLTYNIAFFKKSNDYHPFLYNISGDFCVMVKTFRKNPIFKMIYDHVPIPKEYVHPCPFNHDFNFTNVVLNEAFLKILPVPNGDYLADLKLAFNKVWKLQFKVYGTLSEYSFS